MNDNPGQILAAGKHEVREGRRLDGVQMFRGLAAFTVLLYHIKLQFTAFVPGTPDVALNPWPWTFHRLGFLGVDFFFVLSGFIIHHVHFRDLGVPERGPAYLAKRFFRIQPLLWVIIIVKQTYLTLGNKEPVEWMAVLNTALALPGGKMIGVAWTLTFEWMFYLFFLLCILGGKRWLWAGSAAWALIVLSLGHLDHESWSPWLQVPTSPYVMQFICGVVAAECFRRFPTAGLRSNLAGVGLAVALVGAGIVIAPFNLTPRQWEVPLDMAFGRYYWGVAFGVVVWLAAVNDSWFRGPWMIPMLLVGNASYALYLFHNEMLQAFIRIGHAAAVFKHGPAVLWMWVFAFVLLAAGVVIHLAIERPLLVRSRRWISRGKTTTTVPEPEPESERK